MTTPFKVRIDPHGRVTFDLGANPEPELLQRARELAASMGGEYVVMSGCLSADERETIAQRLAARILSEMGR
jgi:sugar phosphate isomerase/epimerase